MSKTGQKAFEGQFRIHQEGTLDAALIEKAVTEILYHGMMLTLATIHNGAPSACTAYFAASDQANEIWFLSETMTAHSQNIQRDPIVAVNISLPTTSWGQPIRGAQITGRCAVNSQFQCRGLDLYQKRFPESSSALANGFSGDFKDSRFHCITVDTLKVINMPLFGGEVYVALERAEK